MKHFLLLLALSAPLLAAVPVFAQRSDLSGLTICIDPGHGGHNAANDRHLIPDPGIDFWESESNFQKALLLKGLLEAQGATVLLTRTTNDYPNDADEPTLAARVAFANANAVDWFHSIHSNATGLAVNNSINYTLMLVREKRSLTDPAASTGPGLGVPQTQEAWDISTQFMSPTIKNYLRTNSYTTYLDWTFYGGANGGFSLGVLRGLLMPGELSEGSMHDFFPETRRLMNNDYRAMEAYALRNSFLRYFQVPPDTLGIIAGIQTDIASAALLNYSRVRVMPEGNIYGGDGYNNGFYMFDRISPGIHTVVFETPGVMAESVDVAVSADAVTFADRSLQVAAAPVIVRSTPIADDTLFNPTYSLVLNFSKPMDTASVRGAFSIIPAVGGRLFWNPTNVSLTFDPDSTLPLRSSFVLRIDTSAHSSSGQQLDGNGDGSPGDPFILAFRTTYVDVIPPFVTTSLPRPLQVLSSPTQALNFLFSEELNPASVSSTNFLIQKIGVGLQSRSAEYAEANGRYGVTLHVLEPLQPGASYRIRISGVSDTAGNAMSNVNPLMFEFSVGNDVLQYAVLDSMNGTHGRWLEPAASIGTTGIDSASFGLAVSPKIMAIVGNPGSGVLKYAWAPGSPDHLLTLEMDSSVADQLHWTRSGNVLQVYLFGDASGHEFRFVVDDSVEAFPSGTPDHREVSPWQTIDWVGWRLVQWDCERDSVGQWTGNGRLEGVLRFRALQLRMASVPLLGTMYFDQLQIAQRVGVVSAPAEPVILPGHFALYPCFPNPFNPSTRVRYSLARSSNISVVVYDLLGREVATLVHGHQPAGEFNVTWDAAGVSSGVYILRMSAAAEDGSASFTASTKMVLVR